MVEYGAGEETSATTTPPVLHRTLLPPFDMIPPALLSAPDRPDTLLSSSRLREICDLADLEPREFRRELLSWIRRIQRLSLGSGPVNGWVETLSRHALLLLQCATPGQLQAIAASDLIPLLSLRSAELRLEAITALRRCRHDLLRGDNQGGVSDAFADEPRPNS